MQPGTDSAVQSSLQGRYVCFFVKGGHKPMHMYEVFLYFDTHRVVLKDMCVQFLECCFNPLMRVVRVCNV